MKQAGEKTKEYEIALENAKKNIGVEFEKPGIAKEYKERHYYIKEHKYSNISNPLWLDFANHILNNKSYNIDFNEFLFILSKIGLSIENLKHDYKRVPGSRLISINPGSNLILFIKELT